MEVGAGETRCYWLEPTGTGRVMLRRFTFNGRHQCPAADGEDGCDASHMMRAAHPLPWHQDENGYTVLEHVSAELVPSRSSSSWPRRCTICGQRFPRDAEWQAAWAQGYVRSDDGETVWTRHVMGAAFAGALFDAPWLHGRGGSVYHVKETTDGVLLAAVCPNGAQWIVDGQASSGGYWDRVGDPRDPATLTVSPSIVADDYHGFLQAGVFSGHIG